MASSSLVSVSKSKLFSLPLVIARRGYAAQVGGCMSSAMVGSKVDHPTAVIKGSILSSSDHSAEASKAWAPDPLTGYYRPVTRVEEIDPVELRQMLLNHKVKPL